MRRKFSSLSSSFVFTRLYPARTIKFEHIATAAFKWGFVINFINYSMKEEFYTQFIETPFWQIGADLKMCQVIAENSEFLDLEPDCTQ